VPYPQRETDVSILHGGTPELLSKMQIRTMLLLTAAGMAAIIHAAEIGSATIHRPNSIPTPGSMM
jgi:hypothetical protein